MVFFKNTSFKWDNAGNLLKDDKANYTYNIRGSEILASSNEYAKTYYHYANDEMGSCTHIIDDKQILNQYEYDAWGNVTSQKATVKNRFKFNGQQLDPITQQYYLRVRFYNPIIGRFTQEDTYRGNGLNLYSYCANNPVYYVDPSGNVCQKLIKKYIKLRKKGLSIEDTFKKIKGYELTFNLDGVGSYSRNSKNGAGYTKVGGHHIYAKAAFKENSNYSLEEAFCISQGFMKNNNLIHKDMTNKQRELFDELFSSGRNNTLEEHTRIAFEALKAGGASDDMAEILVLEAALDLDYQNVLAPTRIPWH